MGEQSTISDRKLYALQDGKWIPLGDFLSVPEANIEIEEKPGGFEPVNLSGMTFTATLDLSASSWRDKIRLKLFWFKERILDWWTIRKYRKQLKAWRKKDEQAKKWLEQNNQKGA